MLLSRDEVSVPQLGTFIVKDMSSRRVDEEGIFLPPYRTVSFRWDEQESGDDFVSSLSKLHNMSRHEARIMCVECVDELQQTLADEGSVAVGSMGYLLCDEDTQEISFMPTQSGIASPAYYGLDVLPFAKLSNGLRQHRDKKQARKKTRIIAFASESDTYNIRINRRFCNFVTAVAASVVLFFTFTSPYGTVQTGSQMAESEFFMTPKMLPAAKPQPKEVEQPVVAVEAVEEKAVEAQEEPSLSTKKEEMPYVIVLASAVSKKNAIGYAEKLREQGYDAKACEVGGMVRVIIPGYETQEAAYDEIRRMRANDKEFSNAWPYLVKGEIKSID